MTSRRRVLLAIGALALGASRSASAEDALDRRTLDQAADQHATMSAVLRERTWNAETVRRLGRWARGERQAATTADLELLRDELARPVALTVAGAVSMGSYQGGFLYYYLRALTATRALAGQWARTPDGAWAPPERGSPLSLVTGASSGSINAVIAALASCQAPVLDPRHSLFWKAWLPVGGDKLTKLVRVYPDGLLSLKPVDDAVQAVTDVWTGELWSLDPCRVDVGLNATRVRSRMVQPLDVAYLRLPIQTEKVMFRIEGAGGAQPALTPFTWPKGDAREAFYLQLFRKLGAADRPRFDDVMDMLRASSAFSMAFPPQWLHLTARNAGTGQDPCDNGKFTDGGVFDDRPVGLAVQMQRWRLAAEGKDEATSHTRYVVQDPDVTIWQPSRDPDPTWHDEPPRKSFLDTWLPFVTDFLSTSFDVELIDTLEREATLYAGLEIPSRRVPVAGAYLMEFLAFAETDFRTFDFFTGMVDAWQDLAESSLAFQVLQAVGGGPTFDDAPEFDCLKSHRTHQLFNAGPPPSSVCDAVGTNPAHPDPLLRQNLEALLHASAATLDWSGREHAHKDGEPPVLSDQHVFLQALGTAPKPYWYRDLKYRGVPATASTVDLAIRDHLQDIIERTTFDQPQGMSRFVLGSVGKAVANYYAYRPPSVFGAAGLLSDRGFELQGGFRLPWNGWRPAPFELRVDGALRVIGIHLQSFDTQPEASRIAAFTYMAAAHLTNELQLQQWAPDLQSALQFHLGGGWAVESLQTWNGPLMWRHGPEVLVGMAAFQRFYFDIVTNFYLDDCAGNNRCARAAPSLSDKIPAIVDASWGLRFALGYRFFLD